MVIGYDGNAYTEVSNGSTGFADSTAFEANGTGDDPLLSDPAAGDFTLQSTSSPCHQAGDNSTGVTKDYAGNTFSDPPSIGAYEY